MKIKLIIINLLFFSLFGKIPLFEKFPDLQKKLSYISFCDLPTPINKLENFSKYLNYKNIYIKRDDLTGKKLENGMRLYGGNKPRKLEFLLADALNKDAKTIITFGCAGSNHALAISVYSKVLGLNSILMLKPQPNSYIVRHNLLFDNFNNSEIKFFENNKVRAIAAQKILEKDKHSYLVPTGGSNAIGAIGFVNAALELSGQIQKGELQEPDFIYVATGSCGTTAGLLLGLKIAGLKSKIVSVCVEPEEEKDEFLFKIKNLFKQVNKLLNKLDSTIKLNEFPDNSLIINKNFCGKEYGLFIKEVMKAGKVFKNLENINLEGTYSAKPIAAIIDDGAKGLINDKVVLFWNTYCGFDFSYLSNFYDYKKLPADFHKYFENDVQEINKIN